MAFTTTDLTAIESAIATGELKVEIDGKLVIYRAIEELRLARDIIRAELQSAGSEPAAIRTSYAIKSRD